jgi:hypothetical protein
MLKYLFAVVIVGACSVVAIGCAENTAATAKCKDSSSGDDCKECCSKNGASGNTYTSGGGCTCRGG